MESKQSEAFGQSPPPSYDGQQGYDHGAVPAKQPLDPAPPPYAQQQYMNQQYQPVPMQNQPVYAPPGQTTYGPGGQPMIIVNPSMSNPPSSHLNLAIFVTLCCCWPIGIFAILRASSCKSAITHGDRVEAERLSKEAKRFSMWGLIVGIIFNVLSIAIVVAIYALYIIPSWNFY